MPQAKEWLIDTNLFLRYQSQFALLRGGNLVLSSVTVQELLVIIDPEKRPKLKAIFGALQRGGLILTPSQDDWIAVGNRLRRLMTTVYRGRSALSKGEVNLLVRDALIAQCAIARNRSHRQTASHIECVIVTDNINDFEKVTDGARQKLLAGKDLFGA